MRSTKIFLRKKQSSAPCHINVKLKIMTLFSYVRILFVIVSQCRTMLYRVSSLLIYFMWNGNEFMMELSSMAASEHAEVVKMQASDQNFNLVSEFESVLYFNSLEYSFWCMTIWKGLLFASSDLSICNGHKCVINNNCDWSALTNCLRRNMCIGILMIPSFKLCFFVF